MNPDSRSTVPADHESGRVRSLEREVERLARLTPVGPNSSVVGGPARIGPVAWNSTSVAAVFGQRARAGTLAGAAVAQSLAGTTVLACDAASGETVRVRRGTTDRMAFWPGAAEICASNGVMAGSNTWLSALIVNSSTANTASAWNDHPLVVISSAASGHSAMAFWSSVAGVAPIWGCNGGNGERLRAVNSAQTAFIGIDASQFLVGSSHRFKDRVVTADRAAAVELIRAARVTTYRPKVRPQTVVETRDDADVVSYRSADHDCTVHSCTGTVEAPCPIVRNDTRRWGPIAEELHRLSPEVVDIDDTGQPMSVDVGQSVFIAWAAIQQLLDRVERLEVEVAVLRGQNR